MRTVNSFGKSWLIPFLIGVAVLGTLLLALIAVSSEPHNVCEDYQRANAEAFAKRYPFGMRECTEQEWHKLRANAVVLPP